MATTRLNNANILQQNQYNQNLLRQQSLGNQMSYAKLAQVDPYFALGNLIGNAMSDRYNQRGVDKEMGEISNALAAYKGDQNFKAMNSVLDNNAVSGVNANIGGDPNNSISVGFPAPDVGQNEQHTNAQLANSTPSENSIGALTELANKGQMGKFNLDDFKAKYFEDARNRGRSNLQIQQAWANMQPQLDAFNTEAKKQRGNELISSMFGKDKTFSLENAEDLQNYAELLDVNPTMATLVMKNMTNKAALEGKKQLAEQNFNQRKELARIAGDNKLALKGLGGNDDKSLIAAEKQLGSIRQQIAQAQQLGQEVPQSLKDQYNHWAGRVEQLRGGNVATPNTQATFPKPDVPTNTQQPANNGVDWNDYNAAMPAIFKMAQQAKGNQEALQGIADAIDQKYGGDDVKEFREEAYRQLARNGYKMPEQPKQEKKADDTAKRVADARTELAQAGLVNSYGFVRANNPEQAEELGNILRKHNLPANYFN